MVLNACLVVAFLDACLEFLIGATLLFLGNCNCGDIQATIMIWNTTKITRNNHDDAKGEQQSDNGATMLQN